MMLAVPLLLASLWALLALGLGRAGSFARARRVAAALLSIGAIGSFGLWLLLDPARTLDPLPLFQGRLGASLQLSARGFLGLAPAMIAWIGVVAVALSDSISHSRATLRRIVVLLAIATAFVAVREIAWLAVLWTLSSWVAWSELRERFGTRGVARLFAVYQGASVALFGLAAGLDALGWLAPSAIALIAAIGLREAVMPGQSWLPRFVERAPMGLVVAYVAPQLGVYAHVELLSQGLPGEWLQWVPVIGASTALLAAALGLVQRSARRALAYLLMSQSGLVFFGLDGASEVAHAGALLQWQVLAIATSGLAMTLSALEARRGSLDLASHSGCFAGTPRMAAGFLFMGLASVGFPLTLGFVAEDLLVQGAVEHFPGLAMVLIGATALNGMTVVKAFFRLFSGRRLQPGERDLTSREAWVLSAVLLGLLVGGIAPGWITSREFPRPPVARTWVPHVSERGTLRAFPKATKGSSRGGERRWGDGESPCRQGDRVGFVRERERPGSPRS